MESTYQFPDEASHQPGYLLEHQSELKCSSPKMKITESQSLNLYWSTKYQFPQSCFHHRSPSRSKTEKLDKFGNKKGVFMTTKSHSQKSRKEGMNECKIHKLQLLVQTKIIEKIQNWKSNSSDRQNTVAVSSNSSYQLSITPGTCTTLPWISP